MKNIFFAILLVVCGVAYGQKETVYTAKELEQKLECQKIELKKESIDDKIAAQDKRIVAQDKRIDEAQDHLSKAIDKLAVIITIILAGTAVVGLLIDRSNSRVVKEVRVEITSIKNETNREFLKIRNEADLTVKTALLEIDGKIKEIESLLEKAKGDVEYISNAKKLVDKIQENKEGEDNKEVKEETERTVKDIDEKLPIAKYTFDDWFLKGYDAREKGLNEDAAFYYRKATESEDFETENILNRGATYNNWGFALFDLAKSRGSIKEDQTAINDKWFKANELKNLACLYNLARIHSLLGEKDKAFEWLDKAAQKLWKDETFQERLKSDPDLGNLRQDSRFEKLLNKYRPLDQEE